MLVVGRETALYLSSFLNLKIRLSFSPQEKYPGTEPSISESVRDKPVSRPHLIWRGKRKKSPNRHGTCSLLDILPVRATINADTTVVAQTLKLKFEDDGD
jgi:hypothetical protein